MLRSRHFDEIEAELVEVLAQARMTNFVRERLEQHLALFRRARGGAAAPIIRGTSRSAARIREKKQSGNGRRGSIDEIPFAPARGQR